MSDVIVFARITEMPMSFSDPMPKVMVITEGNEEEHFLFTFYPDEISFSPEEFLGLSLEQGRALKFSKDVAYPKAR